MSEVVSLLVFEDSAPAEEWKEVATLFVSCFSTAPYFEDPKELAQIVAWGPRMLAGEGRLVVARRSGEVIGFALAYNLAHDPSWQRTLERLVTHHTAATVSASPSDTLVVHELAVAHTARGRGVAAACMRGLLDGRGESWTVLGTYERAEAARSLYTHWGFDFVGRVPMEGDGLALHVLASRTYDVVGQLRPHERGA